MKLFVGVCLVAGFLYAFSSCASGPDYISPAITPPGEFVSQDVFERLADESTRNRMREGDDESANWWRGFSDPILNQLVDETLNNNYSIAVSEARLNDAEAQLRRAISRNKISTGVSLDSGIDRENEFGSNADSTTSRSVKGAFSLVWPFDISGKNKREVEAAAAELESASAALRGVILEASADVAIEYLRLRGNQRQLTLLNGSVALQEKTQAIVKSRFDAGLAPELDLRRAEASVENLRADIPPLQEEILNSCNHIAVLTGNFPGKYDALLDEEKDIPSYHYTIEDILPIEVLTGRPDIRRAEANLKNAVANIGVAEAEFYPEFQIGNQISLGGIGKSSEPAIGVFIEGINAIIQQVVEDGGARQANLDSAKARAEESLAEYHLALLDAIQEVETSLAALQSTLDRQVPLSKSVEASTRSAFQAEVLYRQGLASFLDVVDAQRVLASAQQRLASTRTAYAVEVANLFRVLGTEVETAGRKSDSESS